MEIGRTLSAARRISPSCQNQIIQPLISISRVGRFLEKLDFLRNPREKIALQQKVTFWSEDNPMDMEDECRRLAASPLNLGKRTENLTGENKYPLTAEVWLDFADRIKTAKIRKNRDFIVTGSHHASLYINHDGWLFRYKILRNGRRQILNFILPGEIFGLQACLYKSSLYSVAAVTDALLSVIPASMLDEIFERSPTASKALFCSAVCESAVLGEHLIDTGRRSAYERISHFLLELFARLSRVGLTNDWSFQMPLTQELVSDTLGLTTIHVNRTIRMLREDKLIATDGKCVTILDYEALSLLSDFDNSYLAENINSLLNDESTSKIRMTARSTIGRAVTTTLAPAHGRNRQGNRGVTGFALKHFS